MTNFEPLKGAQDAPRDYRLRAHSAYFGVNDPASIISGRGGAGPYVSAGNCADAFVSPSAARSIEEAVRAGETLEVIVGQNVGVAAPTFFSALAAELRQLDEVIGVGQIAIEDLRERAFGSWPVPGSAGGKDGSEGPPPACESLLSFVRQLTARASRVAESAQVLNGRL